ncbi:MAG: hypothetical protein AAB267_06450, partial [Candidatus Desantisbacteria bacterium]
MEKYILSTKTKWTFLAILVILVAHSIFLSSSFYYNAVDDAYISFRYAKNLVDGNGIVYNPGERVEGYTNFLWVIIMALFMRLGISDIAFLSIWLGITISVGTIVILYKLSTLITRESDFFKISAPLFLVVDSSFVFWTVSGLETQLFTFLILTGGYAYIR